MAVQKALEAGPLERHACELCGVEAVDAHHATRNRCKSAGYAVDITLVFITTGKMVKIRSIIWIQSADHRIDYRHLEMPQSKASQKSGLDHTLTQKTIIFGTSSSLLHLSQHENNCWNVHVLSARFRHCR